MASKVKEKSTQVLLKDETKCRELIEHLKKTLHLWFLYGSIDDTILEEVLNSCVVIIMHGLKNDPEKVKKINCKTEENNYKVKVVVVLSIWLLHELLVVPQSHI